MELFPAIVIGGPPHSGKSVLTYSLTQALRARDIQHYVLRAAPDGEGDWAYDDRSEAARETVRLLRVKGEFTADFVDHICRSLAARHLPLLVDAGGRPSTDQERIFDYCTHAILLTRDQASHATWLDLVERHALPLVADLTSRLDGESHITDSLKATGSGPVLRGIVTGLEQGAMARGPVFDALVERVAAIFSYDADELRRMHLALAPVETVVELRRLAHTLKADPNNWEPQHLPQVLDYLPGQTPLGLYDRGPNWLYAALALHTHPASLYQFDVRLGWITAPTLRLAAPASDAPLQTLIRRRPDHIRLDFSLSEAHLDYNLAGGLTVPAVPKNQGVVLSGKLPLWLWTALAIAYQDAPWLAIYQPRWDDQALVIRSRLTHPLPGTLIFSSP